MSFFSIADPVERDRVVKEYATIIKDLKEKKDNQKNEAMYKAMAQYVLDLLFVVICLICLTPHFDTPYFAFGIRGWSIKVP